MIILPARQPSGLLSHIKQRIDERRIKTWSYDEDGDFTHTAEQWNQLAWFRPSLERDAVHLHILAPTSTPISKQTYAIYHGRFIEMALRHFDTELSGTAQATPLPEGDDVVG